MERKTGVAIITIGTVVFGAICTLVYCYAQKQILDQAQSQTILINQKLQEISNPYYHAVPQDEEPI